MMKRTFGRVLMLSVVAPLAAPALAQNAIPAGGDPNADGAVANSASPSSPRSEAEETQASDIIVSARRRDETSIAVPVVITAIGGRELQQRALNTIDTIARVVPQLLVGESGGSYQGGSVAIRGISGSDGNPFADQAVSFNIDGVQIARAGVRRLGEMDVQQIEVLKGPQALFFGKNSPGGIISIRSADPTSSFKARVSGGYDFNGREFRSDGYASGPLTDTLGARIALYGSDLSGWVKNIAPQSQPLASQQDRVPKTREGAARLTLKWDPTDKFDARFKISYNNAHNSGITSTTQLVDCPYGAPQLGIADECRANDKSTRVTLGPGLTGLDPGFGDGKPFVNTRQTLGSLELNYHLTDVLTLTSLTGFYQSRVHIRDALDISYNPNTILDNTGFSTDREISEEVRFASSFDGPLNFMVGGYYQDSAVRNRTITYLGVIKPVFVNNIDVKQDGTAYSVFAQATYKIVPTLELSAGGRYSSERKKLPYLLIGTPASPGLNPAATLVDHDSWHNFSPEVSLTYRPTQTLTVFGAYKRGFLSGGFNGSTPGINQDLHYDQQTIEGFEGGVKTALFDHHVRLDLAAYRYIVKGLQTTVFQDNVVFIANAGKVTIKGVEGSIDYTTPLAGLALRGALAYNHGIYNRYNAACYRGQTQALGCNLFINAAGRGTAQRLDGTVLTRAPLWSGNAGFDYQHPISSALKIGFGGDTTYTSSYLTDAASKPASRQHRYALIGATARVAPVDDRWEVALIGRNLTDKYYFVRSSDQPNTGTAPGGLTGMLADTGGTMNRGREVMLRLTINFGG